MASSVEWSPCFGSISERLRCGWQAREFLNEVCTDTLHLNEKTIKRYKNCNCELERPPKTDETFPV